MKILLYTTIWFRARFLGYSYWTIEFSSPNYKAINVSLKWIKKHIKINQPKEYRYYIDYSLVINSQKYEV